MKGNGLKIVSVVLTVAGAGISIASSIIGKKQQDAEMKKAALEAVSEVLNNKED